MTFASWPPPMVQNRAWFLQTDGGLAPAAPLVTVGSDRFVSDPHKPVPYRPRPIRAGAAWASSRALDQRFADGRPDVLTWASPPLAEDLTVVGAPTAVLHAAITGTDADWFVKLIDAHPGVYPAEPDKAGQQLLVSDGAMRARYRRDFTRPEPVISGAVETYRILLNALAHTFRKGHRVMVQIQSTRFPFYDRNPQTYVENIFLARAEDFRAAEHTIHRTAHHATRVELPVLVQAP
jgi:hypothetical protein